MDGFLLVLVLVFATFVPLIFEWLNDRLAIANWEKKQKLRIKEVGYSKAVMYCPEHNQPWTVVTWSGDVVCQHALPILDTDVDIPNNLRHHCPDPPPKALLKKDFLWPQNY